MRKLFFVVFSLILIPLSSCDDGDVIDFELDFEDTFQVCEGESSIVFYKTKNDPSESISIKINNLDLEDIFEVDENLQYEETFNISTSAPLNYRTYSNSTLPSDLFCNVIPNSEVNIKNDDESTSGTVTINTVLVEDDNDGIPAELESTNGINPIEDDDNDGILNYLDDAPNDNSIGDENGNIELGFDTDGDGLPNYLDADDDGDNVLTKDEDPDPNGDGDLSDALNTNSDEDDLPNYLDPDDDGDGIITRNEENDSEDLNPANDITSDGIADYLNKDVANIGGPIATAYREHTIIETYTVTLTVSNFDLNLISLDTYDFGTLNNGATSSSRTETPDFP